jgi:Putative Actinobacterial Holin-X, holin superfamily III
MTQPLPDQDIITERPPLGALFGELANHTADFARAEIRYYQAQAGERASHALPALIAMAAGGIIAIAAIGALLVGLTLALTVSLGGFIASLVVFMAAVLVALLLFWFGKGRIKRAFRPLEDR